MVVLWSAKNIHGLSNKVTSEHTTISYVSTHVAVVHAWIIMDIYDATGILYVFICVYTCTCMSMPKNTCMHLCIHKYSSYILSHYITLHSTTLPYIRLHDIALDNITWQYSTLHCIPLHIHMQHVHVICSCMHAWMYVIYVWIGAYMQSIHQLCFRVWTSKAVPKCWCHTYFQQRWQLERFEMISTYFNLFLFVIIANFNVCNCI